MAVKTLTIDGKSVSADETETILEVATDAGINIPTLCHLEGLSESAPAASASSKSPARTNCSPPAPPRSPRAWMSRLTAARLIKYRLMILELLFAERNHVCAVCVANGHCDLQHLAADHGMTHVRFPYLYPKATVDASHDWFALDHNRCILCTRCVRVCDEIEGAHTWDVMGRGTNSRVITDLNEPGAIPKPAPVAASASRSARPAPSPTRADPSGRW